MTLPNLFIPGAEKAATSTIAHLLDGHKDVCAWGRHKEPGIMFESRTRTQWVDLYERHYANCRGQKIIADPSQYMGFDPRVPQRIRELLGESVRFIVSLRNPVDRVVSAFTHTKYKLGWERSRQLADLFPDAAPDMTLEQLIDYELASVERALSAGAIRWSGDTSYRPGLPCRYFNVSSYSRHIRNFLDFFPRQNFLFLTFEEVSRDQDRTKKKIAEFLDIDPAGFDASSAVHGNRTMAYRNRLLRLVVWPIRITAKRVLPRKVLYALRTAEVKWLMQQPEDRFDDERYRRLLDLFQPEIERTELLTGLDLSSWRPRT